MLVFFVKRKDISEKSTIFNIKNLAKKADYYHEIIMKLISIFLDYRLIVLTAVFSDLQIDNKKRKRSKNKIKYVLVVGKSRSEFGDF